MQLYPLRQLVSQATSTHACGLVMHSASFASLSGDSDHCVVIKQSLRGQCISF